MSKRTPKSSNSKTRRNREDSRNDSSRKSHRKGASRPARRDDRGSRKKSTGPVVEVTGKVTVNRRGFGFVKCDNEGEVQLEVDIFIPAQYLGTALTGDKVLCDLNDPDNSKGPCGQVIKVLERHRHKFVGQIVDHHQDGWLVQAISGAFGGLLEFENNEELELKVSDWVEFAVTDYPEENEVELAIVRKIESKNPISGILDSLTEEYELPRQYTLEEEKTAAEMVPTEVERRDLTEFLTMTIDPVDAKDFDDALSIMAEDEKSITIGIHIADVAAYVTPGSYFDQIASKRCFTNYLPGRMIPMLPKPLLKNRCSLNEGEVKLAHTVVVKLSKSSGAVEFSERFLSLVKVDKRLNYGEVQEFLDSTSLPCSDEPVKRKFDFVHHVEYSKIDSHWDEWSKEVRQDLNKLLATYEVLREKRKALEGFLTIMPKEIRVLCSEEPPLIKGLKLETQDASHEIVEEFMLLANTLVAEELLERRIPGVYRVHPAPEMESLEKFNQWIMAAFKIKGGSLRNRRQINKLLGKLDTEDPTYEIIILQFLKTMQRALYKSVCEEHYGLGKEKYTHFTSPIRRYSDLLVHQQLWAIDTEKYPLRSEKECAAIADFCTKVQINYDSAYWAANDRMKLQMIKDQILEGKSVTYQAVVLRVSASEISVYMPELGMFGEIPYSSFDEYMELDKSRMGVTGKRTGVKYRCGHFIAVRVEEVNPMTSELVLKPKRF